MARFKAAIRFLVPALTLFSVPLTAADQTKDPGEIGGRNVAGHVNLFSIPREIALGKQLAIEVEKQVRIVDDPLVSEYVNRIGQNLVRNSDVTFPVSFKVIESDEINAFTLPGGYIFINTGAIRLSDNEAELASVMAHELGHAAARHATRQVTRSQIAGMGTIPLVLLGGLPGVLGGQAMRLAIPMSFMQFSRAFETEADLLGVEYLWKAGYDPNAGIDMFERVESTERRQPGAVSKYFRSHPPTPERIARTQKNVDTLLPSRDEYVINTSEYEEVRARLTDLLQARKPEVKDEPPTLRRK